MKNITTVDELRLELIRLKSEDVNERRIAVKNIRYANGESQGQLEMALPALTESLSDSDGYVQQMAANVIGRIAELNKKIPENTIDALQRLANKNDITRSETERSLRKCGISIKRCGEDLETSGHTLGEAVELYGRLFADRKKTGRGSKPVRRPARIHV